MSDAADGWQWYQTPTGSAHLVRDGEEAALCGLAVKPDGLREAKTHLGVPVPYHRADCSRCRASYAREQLDAVDIDTDAIEEGDGIIFWDGADPTDPSAHPLRKTGIVEEVPPYEMFSRTDRRDTVVVTDRLKVRTGSMTLTSAPLEGRIYGHEPGPDDPDSWLSGGIGEVVSEMASKVMRDV